MNFVIASEVGLRINTMSDVIEAIGQCYGFGGLLLTEDDLARAFFDLHTGLAGELFQKCTMYDLVLAIVVKDLTAYSPRILELAHEHRHHRLIRFFADFKTASSWLETRT
jgi:Domain of unknown function (DUF4180)